MEFMVMILAAAVRSGTPIIFATLGEILTEKGGILNLGLEGIMLVGALTGFAVSFYTGQPWLGIGAAFLAGMALVSLHAFVSITLRGNQVVSGLALTIFGTGVSAFLGQRFIGLTITGLGRVAVPGLSTIPVVGRIFFEHDLLVYVSYFLVAFLWWFLVSTRAGLHLRAVGDTPRVAEAMGIDVTRVRYLATLLGGGIVAVGGAYLSVVYTNIWTEGMSAGRGWIAVALVIFAIWHPGRAAFGAYLFGGVVAFQLRLQAAGTRVPIPLLMMLPYLLTIVVLVFITIRQGKGILFGSPASLGQPYFREEST
ncbi:MAG TPA: ABC transporter permease [Atribacteraceae bacterium]|nr:ABC transporter permease [Atribacteraceae bacterium]